MAKTCSILCQLSPKIVLFDIEQIFVNRKKLKLISLRLWYFLFKIFYKARFDKNVASINFTCFLILEIFLDYFGRVSHGILKPTKKSGNNNFISGTALTNGLTRTCVLSLVDEPLPAVAT